MSRSRVYAIGCAAIFLTCEALAHPVAEMGLCDDWSYVRTAAILARTGHIVYNGWATAMLGWQLYFAALFMRLLGPTYMAARLTTIVVAAASAFLMQRIFVRLGLNDWNAGLGTLAVMLSPLYLMISASFMTDVQGVFAICFCLYGCLRAIASADARRTIGWLCAAGLGSMVFGTSRQIAWLGVLSMVPATAWWLRRRRGVLPAGAAIFAVGAVFVLGCMRWFRDQPYSLPETLLFHVSGLHQIVYMSRQLARGVFEVPFLLLGVSVAFLPEIRRGGWKLYAVLGFTATVYAWLAVKMANAHGGGMMLEPLLGDWIGPQGFYGNTGMVSAEPVFLGIGLRAVLTAVTMVSVFCMSALAVRVVRERSWRERAQAGTLSWSTVGVLLGPFTLVYFALLIPRSTANLYDRYLMPLMLVLAVVLLRAYQQFVAPRLPLACVGVIALTGLFSIGATHDMFAMYRARIAVAQELAAAGIGANRLENGFEYDEAVEVETAGHVNDPRLVNPPNSYVALDPYRGWTCSTRRETDPLALHMKPEYGIAFRSDACRGPTPFAPVSYFRWLGMQSTNIYVVKFGPVPPA